MCSNIEIYNYLPSVYSACRRPRYASHLFPMTFPQVKQRIGIIMLFQNLSETDQICFIHLPIMWVELGLSRWSDWDILYKRAIDTYILYYPKRSSEKLYLIFGKTKWLIFASNLVVVQFTKTPNPSQLILYTHAALRLKINVFVNKLWRHLLPWMIMILFLSLISKSNHKFLLLLL